MSAQFTFPTQEDSKDDFFGFRLVGWLVFVNANISDL